MGPAEKPQQTTTCVLGSAMGSKPEKDSPNSKERRGLKGIGNPSLLDTHSASLKLAHGVALAR